MAQGFESLSLRSAVYSLSVCFGSELAVQAVLYRCIQSKAAGHLPVGQSLLASCERKALMEKCSRCTRD